MTYRESSLNNFSVKKYINSKSLTTATFSATKKTGFALLPNTLYVMCTFIKLIIFHIETNHWTFAREVYKGVMH